MHFCLNVNLETSFKKRIVIHLLADFCNNTGLFSRCGCVHAHLLLLMLHVETHTERNVSCEKVKLVGLL